LAANTKHNDGDKARQRREAMEGLGAYAKEGQLKPDIKNLLNLIAEESDRGAVVIVGSVLEDALLERIIKKLPGLTPPNIKNLIRSGGLLSGFADKMTLAKAQDLIDEDVVGILELIKAMRNACAHSRLPIGFATPALRDVLLLLLHEENAEEIKASTDPLFLRFAFIVVAGYVLMRINGLSHDVAQDFVQGLLTRANHETQIELAKIAASQESRTKRTLKSDRSNAQGEAPTPPSIRSR